MKKWVMIIVGVTGMLLAAGNAGAATYDATGLWAFSTTGNWVYPGNAGCGADDNLTNVPATVNQAGDRIVIEALGQKLTGTVSGATYRASGSYAEDGGTTTVTLNVTFTSSTYGSGTSSWSWRGGGYYCNGGAIISMTKQEAPPTYNGTGIWKYTTSNSWKDSVYCTSAPPVTGFTNITQNGNTFTYADAYGIHTGRVSGPNYIGVIKYPGDSGGFTTETLFVTLASSTQGSGTVTWTWTDGYEICSGGNNITVTKEPPGSQTYDATGIWNYSSSNHWNNCGDSNVSETTTISMTQDQNAFRFAYRGIPMGGLVSGPNYICQTSFPVDGGTNTSSIYFKLLSNTSGSGSVSWYWSDGIYGCYGGNNFTLAKTVTSNQRPSKPVLSTPANGAGNVPLTVTLTTGAFSDPDAGDTHQQTEWQVSTISDFSAMVLSTLSGTRLTSMTVPNGSLTWGKTYYWRVRFYDNRSLGSLWSDTRSFTTVATTNDQNGNGIPDDQEVGSGVDLNGNGIPDVNESDMKSLKTVVGGGQMGVSRKIDPTVTAIGSIESIDPASVSNAARPYLPLGIMSMDLTVFNPANPGEVTVYFSQAAPANAKWYMYNSIEGWLDFSTQATFSADRKSVRLKLKDWGYGDSDGLPNGKILDPGGFGIASWIKGTVTDASTGSKINDAEVKISGLILKSLLDGNYLSMIQPGTHDVSVSASGYESKTVSGLVIDIGSTVTKDFTLTQSGANTYFDAVQKIYIGYYQRPADPAGLIYWANDFLKYSLTDLIKPFASAPESQKLYGTIDNNNIESVINQIYNSLFGRDAEPDGLKYWADEFRAGVHTPATIMLNILFGARDADLQSINNKVIAANLFTSTIDPDLDGSNFQATYAGAGDNIAGRNFLTWYATSVKVPTQAEITLFIKNNIANPGDPILGQ